jgi:hypothetical protein
MSRPTCPDGLTCTDGIVCGSLCSRMKAAPQATPTPQATPDALPALPEPTQGFIVRKWAYSKDDMRSYGRQCIEASRAVRAEPMAPIDMVLHCPKCGLQHVDRDDVEYYDPLDGGNAPEWSNPPHRSHLCRPKDGGCGHVWRPADVPTNGVAAVKTKGKADSPLATHQPQAAESAPADATEALAQQRKEPGK